jgi:hypothetical protein
MLRICSISFVALLLACDANLGSVAALETSSSGDDESASDSTDDSTTGLDGEPIACIGGELCPAGTRCANGLCASECSDDPECASDEYCGLDGLCHSNSVPSCNSDPDCAATQTCINQVCVTLLGGSCDPVNYVQDGCASNAVCRADPEQEQGICYEMPACAADQTCPIGFDGAVCNTGQLPNKDEICLIGLCAGVENCPAQWACVFFGNAVLGVCSNGVFSAACTEDSHCISGNCIPLPGVGGGVCG